MSPEQAFDVIAMACAQVQTNLQGHTQIQQALEVLKNVIASQVPANGAKAK